jgi:hypothetical protein
MTVVAALITRRCTAHASDSYITAARTDGFLEVLESQATKLVRVPSWRGVIAYWGYAGGKPGGETLDLLLSEAARAGEHGSAEGFAHRLADALTDMVAGRRFAKPTDGGIGLHFTAYERVSDYWVPELFLVSNWADSSYGALRPRGFSVTRETYATMRGLAEGGKEHGELSHRLEVHAALHQQHMMLRYVNGDPALFNPIAQAMLGCFEIMEARGELKDAESVETHLNLVRRPVESVIHLVSDFAPLGRRRVGGRAHDLAVSPGGVYESTTGE